MAQFTILRPPIGQTLHIPTVADMTINLTFPLQDQQYLLDNKNLKVILPDNTILVLDNLLSSSSELDNAPRILQPEAESINTHELLVSLGVSQEEMRAAQAAPAAAQNNLLDSKQVDALLISSLDMEDEWQQDNKGVYWLQSSYILPTLSNKLPVQYQAQLGQMAKTAQAGQVFSLPIDLLDGPNAAQGIDYLPQPLLLYLVFTPGTENYDLADFLDLDNMSLSGAVLIRKHWESSPQGACLLKLVVGAGPIAADEQGVHRLWFKLPIFETYMKGATCSVTLAMAVGHRMREGGTLHKRFDIQPNFEANVIYSTPQSAQAFIFDEKAMAIQPSSLAIRALNFEHGDLVLITPLLQALQGQYEIVPQGKHLTLRIFNNTDSFRIILENADLETLLCNNSLIATDEAPTEWLTHVYVNTNYVQENAVLEADTVLTVKTLLNAFLDDEDYLSMQTVLDTLSSHDD